MCLGVGACVPVCLYVCVSPVSELCALCHPSMQIKDEKVIHLLYKEVRGLLLLPCHASPYIASHTKP